MKRILILFILLITSAVYAQVQKKVVIGGGPDPNLTKDWPKVNGPAANEAEIPAAIERYLEQLSGRDLFSGTVLVARDGKPLFFRTYGAGLNNDTKYNIGSINKIFTTTALRQLREQGKIDFDQPLRRYLPDYRSDIADKITIRQLIENRSGMGDIFGPEYMAADRAKITTLRDYLPLFVHKPLEFEPGTRRRYSNAGYIVLGLVIENVSGMSYYDYVRKHIYEPAGMRDTDHYLRDAVVPNLAAGLTRRGDTSAERRSNRDSLPGRGSSAGGGYSTAMDLFRFVQAARAGKLGVPPQDGFGIAGGAPGINAVVEAEGPWVIVVLSNYDPPTAEEVGTNLRRLLGINSEG